VGLSFVVFDQANHGETQQCLHRTVMVFVSLDEEKLVVEIHEMVENVSVAIMMMMMMRRRRRRCVECEAV
jgi:hypothetical protein